MAGVQLLAYTQGVAMTSEFDKLCEFYYKTMTSKQKSEVDPVENFSLTEVLYNGKEYFILKKRFQKAPAGAIFEVVSKEGRQVRVSRFGEIGEGWKGDNEENARVVQALQKWWKDVGSEETEALMEANPEFYEAIGANKPPYSDEEEDEEDDEYEFGQRKWDMSKKEDIICSYAQWYTWDMSVAELSKEGFKYIVRLVDDIARRLVTEMATPNNPTQSSPGSDPNIQSISIHDKSFSVGQLKKALNKMYKGQLFDCAQQTWQRIIEVVEDPVDKDPERQKHGHALLEFYSVTGSQELDVGFIASIEYITAELVICGGEQAKNAKSDLLQPAHVYLGIMTDKDLKGTFDNTIEPLHKILRIPYSKILIGDEKEAKDENDDKKAEVAPQEHVSTKEIADR